MVSYKKTTIDKILEKIPVIATWLVIIFPLVGSFFVPKYVAIFVLTFNVFFLYRSIAFTLQFALSIVKLRSAEQVNWQAKVEGLDNIDSDIHELKQAKVKIQKLKFQPSLYTLSNKYRKISGVSKLPKFLQRIVFSWERMKTLRFISKEISQLEIYKTRELLSYKDIKHVIIIPHAREPLAVLDKTLNRLSKQTFSTKQIYIVLGAEARDPSGYDKSKILKDKYEKHFGDIWISNHVLKDYEIVGKSSNMAAAGKVASEHISKLGWDMKKVTVTSCDADSQLPREYFSLLTYQYLTKQDSEYKFFTGAILLYANIWRLDFIARVRNSMSSMYNLGKLVRRDKFVPFSTYSTSFWLIDKIGYWTPWVTPEDFHIFFKASFKFPHEVSTIPLFCRIMVDAAEGDNAFETFKNNYFQSRRWQWGVSDDGWVIKNLLSKFGKLPLSIYYRAGHVIVDHVLAPTSGFLILLGANLPPFINNKFGDGKFGGTVFGEKLSDTSSFIITLSLYFFIIAILLDTLIKPKRNGVSLLKRLLVPFEWFVNPLVGLFLTSIPGLEAHTRLLFGRYLEYYITKKKAK